MVTWQKGGQIYNYTRQWPYNELRDVDFDQRNVPAAQKKPQGFFQAFYNNFDPNTQFVEDGGFIRLRELAVNYQVPKSLIRAAHLSAFETARIGIVGRNLWTPHEVQRIRSGCDGIRRQRQQPVRLPRGLLLVSGVPHVHVDVRTRLLIHAHTGSD